MGRVVEGSRLDALGDRTVINLLKAVGIALFFIGITVDAKAAYQQPDQCSFNPTLYAVAVVSIAVIAVCCAFFIAYSRHGHYQEYLKKRNYPRSR